MFSQRGIIRTGKWASLLLIFACSSEDTIQKEGSFSSAEGSKQETSTGESGESESGSGGGLEEGVDDEEAGEGTNETPGEGDTDSPVPSEDSSFEQGCEGASFRSTSQDPSLRGPWDVGARTVQIGDRQVEVWYPAKPKSREGLAPRTYDFRQYLPESERSKIPENRNELQVCDCYSELPIDNEYGPYPLVVYIHGSAAFRTASLAQMTHWASRGFVVMAADHPGLWMLDWLANNKKDGETCEGTGTSSDYGVVLPAATQHVATLAEAIQNEDAVVEFLEGRVEWDRLGVAGHSAGGVAATGFLQNDDVDVLIPMQGWLPTIRSSQAQSILGIAATEDAIATWDTLQGQTSFWSLAKRRVLAVGGAGHLMVTELCGMKNDAGESVVEVANEVGICGRESVLSLYDCKESHIDGSLQTEITNFASTAVLEEVLMCRDHRVAFESIEDRYPEIELFAESIE